MSSLMWPWPERMVSGLKPTKSSWLAVVQIKAPQPSCLSWIVLILLSRRQKRKRQTGHVSGCPKLVLWMRQLKRGAGDALFIAKHWNARGAPLPSKVWVAPVQIFGRCQSTFHLGKDHSTAGWIASMVLVESWLSWKVADLNSPTVPWIFVSSVSFHINCAHVFLISPILLFWSLS